MVERILSNEFYASWINWGETNRAGRPVLRKKGKHEPIISAPLFERIKAKREGRTTSKGGYGRQIYSRLFHCGCGGPLYPETAKGRNGTRYTYLRCSNPECSFTSIRESDFEDLVVDALRRYQIKPEFFEEYKSAMGNMSTMILEENEALLEGMGQESAALDEAYFKTAAHFLETFKIIADKYKTAPAEVKREIFHLFFTKHTLSDRKLILEPSPIMQEVATIANLSNGRDDWT
ncbi:recombinase zinc beta ribbon domain-containing protein [Candidatus Peregrinibacteria bacterium]|nr:recombinase zinc beta ribbon domain-containing protein [Candidatus Peregrinibacteria bacterium]